MVRCCNCFTNIFSRIFCCKCCCCCKKQKNLNENNETKAGVTNNNFILEDDESVYNGSSFYEEPISSQPITSATKTEMYKSNSEATSSIFSTESSKTIAKTEHNLQMSMEVKGTLNLGGIEQEVKGVINFVNKEEIKQPTIKKSVYAVNKSLTNEVNSSGSYVNLQNDSKLGRFSTNMLNRPPAPLPRNKDTIRRNSATSSNQPQTPTNTENTNFNYDIPIPIPNINQNNSSIILEEEYYSEPRPALPVKTRKKQDNLNSYISVYGNKSYLLAHNKFNELNRNNIKVDSKMEEHIELATLRRRVDSKEEISRITTNPNVLENPTEHIYEDLKI